MSSILRSSKFVRYFFGLARSIIISNRQEVDTSLLQRSQRLAGILSNNFSSESFRIQSGSPLDQTIRQLDEDARRTGRVSLTEIEDALSKIKNSRNATASQALMVIRCCGNLVPEELPEQRTILVQEIWKTFEKVGVTLDVSHYNALLKVYLENEHKFSPTDFLAKLERDGIEPNRVTYQRLIAGFCQQGDIAGATKILEFMKEKQIPISEGVFNALILGHSKADDMESAEGILGMIKQAGLEASNETYTTLLCGYAARGDTAAVERLLTDCKVKDVLFSDRDFLEMAFVAAVNEHEELLEKFIKNTRNSMGYNQEAANVMMRLITVGKDEAAYRVFLTMSSGTRSTEGFPNMSGHIFIKQLVKSNKSPEEIVSWCTRLQQDGHTSVGLWIAVDASFQHNNIDLTLGLLRVLKQNGEPIRTHYFWPPIVTAGKANNLDRMNDILKQMDSEFGLLVNIETLKSYFLPYVPRSLIPTEILNTLLSLGVRRPQAVVALVAHLVIEKKAREAAELALQNVGLNYNNHMTFRQLLTLLEATGDVKSVVSLLHLKINAQNEDKDEEEISMVGKEEEVVSRFLVDAVKLAPLRKHIYEILKEMLNHGLAISNVCAQTVESRLEGRQLTPEVAELLAELSSGKVAPLPIKRTTPAGTFVRTPENLEKLKEKMKANNESEETLIGINRSLYQVYCYEDDIENALRIKKEFEEDLKQEVTPGMWALLLDAYCSKNDLEGAKNCLEKIKTNSSEFELDGQKILRMAKVYIANSMMDDAVSLLKTVKPRSKSEGNSAQGMRIAAWQTVQQAADTYKDPAVVKSLLDTLVAQGYAERTNAMLGPIIKAYLLRDDMEGALKEFEECVKLHRATPYKNELVTRLIEKEDPTNLQTVVDLSTEVHGEVNSLYDLVLAFIECGRVRQARKILETPGLTSRNNRIVSACERYRKEGQVASLEGLVEATKDLNFIDRSEIYYNLLETYCEADEVDKALGLWTKMQDEDVNVTDAFLFKLGNFLKEKGHQVPFAIPPRGGPINTGNIDTKDKGDSSGPPFTPSPLLSAIRLKNADKALQIKEQMDSVGKKLSREEASRLVELLVQQSRMRDATSVFISLSNEQLPKNQVLNFLVTRLVGTGELELLQRVGQHLPENLQRITSFSNRYMAAAVAAGQGNGELDRLEKEIDAASSPDEIDELSVRFPRGGILAVLESCPALKDQVERIVNKYHSKGSSSPANILVMYHLSHGDSDRAKQLYRQYNLANSSSLMFGSVLKKARDVQEPKILEDLLRLVEGAPSITSEAKALIYSNLILIYSKLQKYDTALEKLEEGLKTVPLDLFHSNSLITLKNGLEANNKPFKYTIPPKKAKDSSSSSSSSEAEAKKSAAASR